MYGRAAQRADLLRLVSLVWTGLGLGLARLTLLLRLPGRVRVRDRVRGRVLGLLLLASAIGHGTVRVGSLLGLWECRSLSVTEGLVRLFRSPLAACTLAYLGT